MVFSFYDFSDAHLSSRLPHKYSWLSGVNFFFYYSWKKWSSNYLRFSAWPYCSSLLCDPPAPHPPPRSCLFPNQDTLLESKPEVPHRGPVTLHQLPSINSADEFIFCTTFLCSHLTKPLLQNTLPSYTLCPVCFLHKSVAWSFLVGLCLNINSWVKISPATLHKIAFLIWTLLDFYFHSTYYMSYFVSIFVYLWLILK